MSGLRAYSRCVHTGVLSSPPPPFHLCSRQPLPQYHDKEPNSFNATVMSSVPPEELPDEMKKVGWTKTNVQLADLYPEKTPLRQLNKQAAALTRKTTTEYVSGDSYRTNLSKNVRVAYNPQQKWHAPITSAQAYGWSGKHPGQDEGVPPDHKVCLFSLSFLLSTSLLSHLRCCSQHYKSSSEEARYAEAMTKQGMI